MALICLKYIPSRSLPPRQLPRRLFAPRSLHTERGFEFDAGGSFFRQESATGRDLGVLAASLHRQSAAPDLRVLDAMCGCGVRSARYLAQAGAAFVWANDANEDCGEVITSNLARTGRDGSWVVTHLDARRLLAESYLRKEYFDFIDVDSFGSDSSFLRPAIEAAKIGGLLYVTSTDGYSSGGHRPEHSLASYGAYLRPMPYSNELGLRVLIGGALREAVALGFLVSPLFSYYSYHGPVFRVMLRVTREKMNLNSFYCFIGFCHRCGNSCSFSWKELGQISCSCSKGEVSHSLTVSGPLWTGPLHDTTYVADMLNLAENWGWTHTGKEGTNLEKLLKKMIDESDPILPFGYIQLDEIASRAKMNSPPLSTVINALKQEGYGACRSHIASNAVKTNCPTALCIQIVKNLQHPILA